MPKLTPNGDEVRHPVPRDASITSDQLSDVHPWDSVSQTGGDSSVAYTDTRIGKAKYEKSIHIKVLNGLLHKSLSEQEVYNGASIKRKIIIGKIRDRMFEITLVGEGHIKYDFNTKVANASEILNNSSKKDGYIDQVKNIPEKVATFFDSFSEYKQKIKEIIPGDSIPFDIENKLEECVSTLADVVDLDDIKEGVKDAMGPFKIVVTLMSKGFNAYKNKQSKEYKENLRQVKNAFNLISSSTTELEQSIDVIVLYLLRECLSDPDTKLSKEIKDNFKNEDIEISKNVTFNIFATEFIMESIIEAVIENGTIHAFSLIDFITKKVESEGLGLKIDDSYALEKLAEKVIEAKLKKETEGKPSSSKDLGGGYPSNEAASSSRDGIHSPIPSERPLEREAEPSNKGVSSMEVRQSDSPELAPKNSLKPEIIVAEAGVSGRGLDDHHSDDATVVEYVDIELDAVNGRAASSRSVISLVPPSTSISAAPPIAERACSSLAKFLKKHPFMVAAGSCIVVASGVGVGVLLSKNEKDGSDIRTEIKDLGVPIVGSGAWSKIGINTTESPLTEGIKAEVEEEYKAGREPILAWISGASIREIYGNSSSSGSKFRIRCLPSDPSMVEVGRGQWLIVPGSDGGRFPGMKEMIFKEQIEYLQNNYPKHEIMSIREAVSIILMYAVETGERLVPYGYMITSSRERGWGDDWYGSEHMITGRFSKANGNWGLCIQSFPVIDLTADEMSDERPMGLAACLRV